MPSWDDHLIKSSDETVLPAPRRRPVGLWIAAASASAAVAFALYLFLRGTPSPEQPTASTERTPAVVDAADRPLGADADPIELPPLDQSDAIVRTLVRQLSAHPQVAAWLATEGLIRNFTVVVTNIAEGKAPAAQIRALRPAGRFEVTGPELEAQIDPRSYERYTPLAQAVASIDPAGSARLYTLLKPRIEEAFAELGGAGASFDRTLERAIVLLLDTPVPDGPMRVVPHGATAYRFDDELFEALKPAQKQLLRMGPDNARAIQARLREIALALNIPADRLPRQDQ